MKKSLGPHTYAPAAPVWVIGTYDKNGKANAMTASWAGVCCSNPPCVSVSLRKATYTYACLESRRCFTVSIPSEKYLKAADFFGTASGKNTDKFSQLKLTPAKSSVVDAPYVEEFPLILECKLIHQQELGLHTLFVGQIMDIKANEEILTPQNLPDFEKLKPIIFDPSTFSYFATGAQLSSE